MTLLTNEPLLSAFAAIILAQAIKPILRLIVDKRWTPALAFGTGGMPSSHAAAVASMATAVAIKDGVDSSSFAIAAVVCAITMYDAAGIRRHAGIHASVLNKMLVTMPDECQEDKALKELLGHRPNEVFAGALFGIAVGAAVSLIA